MNDLLEEFARRIESLERVQEHLIKRLESIQPEANNCPHCGRKVSDQDAACGMCGRRLR